jgi:hypothetical protein
MYSPQVNPSLGTSPADRDKIGPSTTSEQAITTMKVRLSTSSNRKSSYDPIPSTRKRTVNLGQLVFTLGQMTGQSHPIMASFDDPIASTTLNGETVDFVKYEPSTILRFIGTAYKAGGQTGPGRQILRRT